MAPPSVSAQSLGLLRVGLRRSGGGGLGTFVGASVVVPRVYTLRSQCVAKSWSITATKPRRLHCSSRRRQEVITQSAISGNSATSLSSPPPPPPPSDNTTPPNTKPRSRLIPFLTFLAISLGSFTLGFAMSSRSAFKTANEILDPPTDEESLQLYQPDPSSPSYEINKFILEHPLTQQLERDERYIASRPHLKIPPTLRPHNFTGGTLMGGDKITVPPLTFSTLDGSSFVSILHLGTDMCGHPGLVHGGLLATLMDEGLARCCFNALPNKVGVTASLTVNYRKPCPAGTYVVLKAETTKVEGRKAWVKGRLEALKLNPNGVIESSDVFVEAEALFIEPRQAATLAKIYSTSSAPKPPKDQHQTQPGPSG